MKNFTTLFDSNYLDKGLALYYSMERVMEDFCLYIFAFDDKCFEVLTDLHLKSAVIISLEEFETQEMLKVKKERSKAEYCWTCTPISIEYVLDTYGVAMCTYIDADLYFFDDPTVLLEEISSPELSVLITEHRFENSVEGRKLMEKNGKYCVQFNSFKNDSNGRKILRWWKDKCMEWCFFEGSEEQMGDQKYLNTWTRDFQGVHELQNLGGGVAYWNLMQYDLVTAKEGKILLKNKQNNNQFSVIFCHFQNIRYISASLVNIKAGKFPRDLKHTIYIPYLKEVEEIRRTLERGYSLNFNLQKTCSSNPVVAVIQKYVMQYKVRSLSDIISLGKLNKKGYSEYYIES